MNFIKLFDLSGVGKKVSALTLMNLSLEILVKKIIFQYKLPQSGRIEKREDPVNLNKIVYPIDLDKVIQNLLRLFLNRGTKRNKDDIKNDLILE